jgi:hypothetical protein
MHFLLKNIINTYSYKFIFFATNYFLTTLFLYDEHDKCMGQVTGFVVFQHRMDWKVQLERQRMPDVSQGVKRLSRLSVI